MADKAKDKDHSRAEEIGLHNLKPKPGSTHRRKRVGRGEGRAHGGVEPPRQHDQMPASGGAHSARSSTDESGVSHRRTRTTPRPAASTRFIEQVAAET